MPVGLRKTEITHEFISGSREVLNATVERYLGDGWKLLDAKFIAGDFYNSLFSVMYIFMRDVKTIRDE